VPIQDRVNADWIATLGDDQLVDAEARLRDVFLTQETLEKQRRGARYAVLEGPEVLVTAWHRWVMVSNEARTRRLVVQQVR
jgi:hypothetical protein